MRQAIITTKKYVPGALIPGKTNQRFVGSWESVTFFVVFHDFGLDSNWNNDQYEVYPVALCELADGTIECYKIDQIQFVTPTNYSSCES